MKKSILILTIFMLLFSSTTAFAEDIPDFIHSRWSKSYNLSNGSTVRIEYHSGEPHIHENDGSGTKRSEKISSEKAHHSGEEKLNSGTRKLLKEGKKAKSPEDKEAVKKVKKLKEQWEKHEEAEKNSADASQDLIEKNKETIAKAADAGKTIVIIGWTIYLVWWLVKLASGWGILLPI